MLKRNKLYRNSNMIEGVRCKSLTLDRVCWLKTAQGEPKWLPGVVLENVGEVSYCVQVGESVWRRHDDQMH